MRGVEYVKHILELFVSNSAVIETKQQNRYEREQLQLAEICIDTKRYQSECHTGKPHIMIVKLF